MYRHGRSDILYSYRPLFETMNKKGISQYQLLKLGIDNRLLDALKSNKNITVYSLEKICRILKCTANDVVEFIDE